MADGAQEGKEKAAQLINDLQDISFSKIGLIIAGTWLAIALAHRVLPFLAEKGPSRVRLYLLGAVPVIRLVLLVVALLWLVPIIFNITFQNFLVISGAASVAIGFAFKDYVSSLIAGVVAIIERPYQPGDWVEIDDTYGEVRAVGMRAVQIRTPSDVIVHIPHDKLWRDSIRNANDGTRTLMCVTSFYLHPQHDAAAMRAALRDVALTSAYLDYHKPVSVGLEQTAFGTHYRIRAYPFDMRDQSSLKNDLTVRGKLAIADCRASETAAPPQA